MYLRITLAVIHIPLAKDYLSAWRSHGADPLVGDFIGEQPLMAAQYRRLPKAFRTRLKCEVVY
jgi:hypothetical protein